MLTIRLRREGKRKQPVYRVIVSEKARDTLGTYLESLGQVNPHANPRAVVLDVERVKHWLGQGAQCSNTVYNLFVDQQLVAGPKRKVGSVKKTEAEAATRNQQPADSAKEAEKPAGEKKEGQPAADKKEAKPAEVKQEAKPAEDQPDAPRG